MQLRVLTWNLKHGRAVPSAGRELFEDFAAALAGWEWDATLLQEVPPWWPERLGRRLPAQWRLALTSRNLGLRLRRAVATRWPDLIKSNGGGCNALLVRDESCIVEMRTLRLALVPERRWLLGARLSLRQDHLWLGNVHLTGGYGSSAVREARAAATRLLAWADGAPAVLGGDFNVASLSLPAFTQAGRVGVDHVFVHGLEVVAEPLVLDSGRLSDHRPLLVSVG
jgi:endonuclease/exonuclease/phosphatase family metal-dependent hydrolase